MTACTAGESMSSTGWGTTGGPWTLTVAWGWDHAAHGQRLWAGHDGQGDPSRCGEATPRDRVSNAWQQTRLPIRGSAVGMPINRSQTQLRRAERCALCGGRMEGKRRDARYCSAAHRTEASRLRRLLSGQKADGYGSLAHRLEAAQMRTRRSLGYVYAISPFAIGPVDSPVVIHPAESLAN